ncbi:MAG: hypothetical protein QM831_11680 [Kofleriaceae bacterium]
MAAAPATVPAFKKSRLFMAVPSSKDHSADSECRTLSGGSYRAQRRMCVLERSLGERVVGVQSTGMGKKVQQINGTVVAHNFNPRGDVEGMMVETGTRTIQVNLPKHGGKVIPVGGVAALDVAAHDSDGSHQVFELREEADVVEGKVMRFNHSRHGEVNGYVLEGDIFVHMKPDGARREKIRIGQRIHASGQRRVGKDSIVIEADKVKVIDS